MNAFHSKNMEDLLVTNQTLLKFKKCGFKSRQSTKLLPPDRRECILLDCNLNNHPKMMMLHQQKDHTLLGLYLEILFHLDTVTESWQIREDHFIHWARKTFEMNNRFNLQKRLDWLVAAGLIEIERISADVEKPTQAMATVSQTASNPAETLAQPEANPCPTPSETMANPCKTHFQPPLESAQTQAPSTPLITKEQSQTTQPLPSHSEHTLPDAVPPAVQSVRQVGCVFFKIKRPGRICSEKDWLESQLRLLIAQDLKDKAEKQHLLNLNLEKLCFYYPNYEKHKNRWLTQPVEKRMATFAYTILNSRSYKELLYALTVIESPDFPREGPLRTYYQQALKDVKNNDCEVTLNV